MSRKSEIQHLRSGRDIDARRIATLEATLAATSEIAAERIKAAAAPAPAAPPPPAAAPPPTMTLWEQLNHVRGAEGPLAAAQFTLDHSRELAAEAVALRAAR
jgi:hypothetical protein